MISKSRYYSEKNDVKQCSLATYKGHKVLRFQLRIPVCTGKHFTKIVSNRQVVSNHEHLTDTPKYGYCRKGHGNPTNVTVDIKGLTAEIKVKIVFKIPKLLSDSSEKGSAHRPGSDSPTPSAQGSARRPGPSASPGAQDLARQSGSSGTSTSGSARRPGSSASPSAKGSARRPGPSASPDAQDLARQSGSSGTSTSGSARRPGSSASPGAQDLARQSGSSGASTSRRSSDSKDSISSTMSSKHEILNKKPF